MKTMEQVDKNRIAAQLHDVACSLINKSDDFDQVSDMIKGTEQTTTEVKADIQALKNDLMELVAKLDNLQAGVK